MNSGKKAIGDPFQTSAKQWNEIIDAAEYVKTQRQTGITAGARQGNTRQAGIVKVKNIGPDRSQFDIVGLPEPIFDPAEAVELAEFRREVSFDARRPLCEHVAKFGVLLEPINEDAVGLAVVSGVVQCLIEIDEESHRFADITPLDATKLTSLATGGAAQILWKESGLGEKWAIVRISNGIPDETCVSSSTTTDTSETSDTTSGTTGTTPTTGTETTGTETTATATTGTGTTGTGTGTTGTATTGTGTTGTGTTGTGTTGTGTTGTGTTDTTATDGTGTTTTGTTGTGTTQTTGTATTATITTDTTATDGTGTTTTGTTVSATTSTSQTNTTDTTTTGTATTATGDGCPPFVCIGDCVISFEVVTDVRCEDGEIVLDKATLCLGTDEVQLPTATTTAGA